jgi:hypothetical protein
MAIAAKISGWKLRLQTDVGRLLAGRLRVAERGSVDAYTVNI